MQGLDQRILLAATILLAALAVFNENLPATILAVAFLAARLLATYRMTPR